MHVFWMWVLNWVKTCLVMLLFIYVNDCCLKTKRTVAGSGSFLCAIEALYLFGFRQLYCSEGAACPEYLLTLSCRVSFYGHESLRPCFMKLQLSLILRELDFPQWLPSTCCWFTLCWWWKKWIMLCMCCLCFEETSSETLHNARFSLPFFFKFYFLEASCSAFSI